VVGTRCYFAPERIVGTSFQSSADIWALGVTVSMQATSACVLKLATSVFGLKLLVYEALSYQCMCPQATRVCGPKLLVYAALRRFFPSFAEIALGVSVCIGIYLLY
jgi:serine/threonine protein kinase